METATSTATTRSPATRVDPILALAVLMLLSAALWPIQINRAFGLPAHPLLIHLPVIAIPVLGLALLAVAFRLEWLDRFGIAIGLLSVVSLAATVVAAGAGEAFRDSGEGGPGIAEHAEAGGTLRLIMVGVALAVVAALALRRASRSEGPMWLRGIAGGGWVSPVLRVVFVVAAVASTFFVIRTGHLGAQQTWGDRGKGDRPPAGRSAPNQGGNAPSGDPDGDGN